MHRKSHPFFMSNDTSPIPLYNTTKVIDISFAISDVYAKYLAVSIASIIVNTSAPVRFHIIDGGISQENKRKLGELEKLRNFEIEYLSVDKKKFAKIPKCCVKHVDSDDTNCRLLISTLKPDLDKCIFLDADLVAQGDIQKLWNIDLEDNYIAAVKDQAPLATDSWAKKLPIPPGYSYVNTGVTLINLKKWRKDEIQKKLFKNIKKYRELLWFPDQDTLNITLSPHVQYISPIFNAMPVQMYRDEEQKVEAFSSPIIIHWAGRMKPWIHPHVPYGDLFWKYARLTPFYEEIMFKNVEESSKDKGNIKEASMLSPRIFKDALQYNKIRLIYYRYRILSKITFGKTRRHYIEKKRAYKQRIHAAQRFMESNS